MEFDASAWWEVRETGEKVFRIQPEFEMKLN